MKKLKKYSYLFFLLFVVVLQFIKPNTENPPEDSSKFVTSHLQIPDMVFSRLEKSCFDCHSNRTVWPWYSRISPIVYLINHDVAGGRKHLNFSEWGNYDKKRMIKKLEEIESEIRENEMPPAIYPSMHSDAKLSESDRKMIGDWAISSKNNLMSK